MSRRKSISYLYIFCAFLLACEDPFDVPSANSNVGILVVEGRIGDEETLIQLSRTANLDSFSIKPEVNAVVQIENELGNVVGQLNEVEAGTYFLEMDLTINGKYRISIQTNNQEVYHSDYRTLLLTPPISDLVVKVDTLAGTLEILLSTRDVDNNTRYYLWDYSETHQYRARYTSRLDFDGEKLFRRSDENQITWCWKTEHSTDILSQSTIQFEEDLISNKRIIRYVLRQTEKFVIAYSILVNQYAVSADEYEFWTLLEKNSESLGTLFDPQPSQISSNLQCTSDPSKSVIGFIGSSTRSQKRVFVDGRDLVRNPSKKVFCNQFTISLSQPDEIIRILSKDNFIPTVYVPETNSVAYTTKFCADCREQGGTNVKPSFWF
ncbi:MAG: DUF4249 domain-containing protein [Ekhidna sp.]